MRIRSTAAAAALTLGTLGLFAGTASADSSSYDTSTPSYMEYSNAPDPGWSPEMSGDYDRWAAAGYPDGPGIEDGDQYSEPRPGKDFVRAEDGSWVPKSFYGSENGSRSSSEAPATDTGGAWRTLDRAIASGDSDAIQDAINNKGPDPAYHDRVVDQVKEDHPNLAEKYGF